MNTRRKLLFFGKRGGAAPATYYVRPSGSTYGNGDGTSYNDAWSGFSNVNQSLLSGGNTLAICGTHTEPYTVSQNNYIIDFANINEDGNITFTGSTGLTINGYSGIVLNSPVINSASVQNIYFENCTVIVNDADCNNSGNQSFQHWTDAHVTYNNVKSWGNADESLSAHNNATVILNGDIDFKNNIQAGINIVQDSKVTINGICDFSGNGEYDIWATNANTEGSCEVINNGNSNFLGVVCANGGAKFTSNAGTYTEIESDSVVELNGSVVNLLNLPGLSSSKKITVNGSAIESIAVTVVGYFMATNSQIGYFRGDGDLSFQSCIFTGSVNDHTLEISSGSLKLNDVVFQSITSDKFAVVIEPDVNVIELEGIVFDGNINNRGILARQSVTITNSIFYQNNIAVFTQLGAVLTADHCAFYNNATKINGDITEINSVNADPLFVDTINSNYQLQLGSPCIGQGKTITDTEGISFAEWGILNELPIVQNDMRTVPYDIGAYIFQP